MDKESIIYDTATISDIPELVRLRILYMIDDFGSLTHEEREGMEKHLPGKAFNQTCFKWEEISL